MATRNVRRRGAAAAKEKKGGGKWVFILLLLILLAALAWYFFFNSAEKNFFSDFLPGSDATDIISVEKDKSLSVENIAKSDQNADVSLEDSLSTRPPPPKKPKKVKTQYFIKLGSCLSDLCQREYKRQLKLVKLTTFEKKRSHKTTYFELVSESAYPYARARQKVKIINKYNNKIGFPHIIKHKDQYKISFGLFPERENAQTMKSHLAHLYPQVNMRFLTEPRSGKFTEIKMYTGPFSKSVAEKTLVRVQQIPDFEFATITSKL